MGLLHFSIEFFTVKAVGFHFGESSDVVKDYQTERVFFLWLIALEHIVDNDYLIDHFALRVETFLDMLTHLLDDPLPLFFN